MVKDAIWIRGTMSGRLKIVVAMKPERKNEKIDNENPSRISKNTIETKTFFTFASLFSDLYWAVYFIVAQSMPQSLNIAIRLGPTKAIATSPYSDSERIPATIITPMADMIDEAARPQKMLNTPLAETLPILLALLTETPSPKPEFLQLHKYINKLLI